jgi:hypothetical protein
MVPRFAKAGRSFKAVALYLMHDTEHAQTSERVAWTHTLNLAHDHIPSAVDEMLTTFQNAAVLKSEQGAKASKAIDKPVKHFSLNWHPSEKPERAEMIAAAESFLQHMGWQEHQALIIAHEDKEHRHVHLVVNAVHPETGRKLDDAFEHRRAQAWALGYEQERGKIFCADRERPAPEREESIPRPAWVAIEDHSKAAAKTEVERSPFDGSYLAQQDNRPALARHEWELLKESQREQRLEFFADGKAQYRALNRAIYLDVREECRADWGEYYAAKRAGMDHGSLAEIRAGLVARQKTMMEERFGEASTDLRAQRDDIYRNLLEAQKLERADLSRRQEQGTLSHDLLDRVYPSAERSGADTGKSNPVRDENAAHLDRFGIRRGRPAPAPVNQFAREHQSGSGGRSHPMPERGPTRVAKQSERGASREPATALAGGLLSLIGSLGESLSGGHTKASAPQRRDALERFDIRRGRPPPDDRMEKAQLQQREQDAELYWKKRREPDLSRSG